MNDLNWTSVRSFPRSPARNPEESVALGQASASFRTVVAAILIRPSRISRAAGVSPSTTHSRLAPRGDEPLHRRRRMAGAHDGTVVIAAITSCTNTSNPSVMVGAGLIAQKAAAKGLHPPSYVKTSLAPGSKVVTDYLERAGAICAERARLQPRRVRLHDLYRQRGTPSAGGRVGRARRGPLRSRRAEREPEFRGAHPQPRPRELPDVADVGRGLRARRPDGHRPDHRALGEGPGRPTGSSCGTSGLTPTRSARWSRRASTPASTWRNTERSRWATRTGKRCRTSRGSCTPGIRSPPTCGIRLDFDLPPPLLPDGSRLLVGARALVVLGDRVAPTTSRPPGKPPWPRRTVPPPRPWRAASRVQHLRDPAGQPRGHDPRNVRQRADPERPRRAEGGGADPALAVRRNDCP